MEKGIDIETLVKRYPRLYHMAEAGAWSSIKRHGLLSTSALLDLFEVKGAERYSLEMCHRPHSVSIVHPVYGRAVVRDQKPMSDLGLVRSLEPGIEPRQWYGMLNRKVFFWLTEERLSRMLQARAYKGALQTVMVLDTERLVRSNLDQVRLSPMNSGCTKPFPHPRGHDTFLPLSRYPFNFWDSKRRGKDPIVELVVEDRVADVEDYIVSVTEVVAGKDVG